MAENTEKETFELKQKSTMRKKEYKNLLDQGAIISKYSLISKIKYQ